MNVNNIISVYPGEVNYDRPDRYHWGFEPREKILPHITKNVWSPVVFRGGMRSEKNFESCDYAALDIDEGYEVGDVASSCRQAGLAYIIAPTKSHKKIKENKPACDRFRLVFKFERRITSLYEYRHNMTEIVKAWGADSQCKDGARFFYPSAEVLSYGDGNPIGVTKTMMERKTKFYNKQTTITAGLPTHIARFLRLGTTFGDGRNCSCYVTACELFALGYTSDQIITMLIQAPFPREKFEDIEIINAVNSAERKR